MFAYQIVSAGHTYMYLCWWAHISPSTRTSNDRDWQFKNLLIPQHKICNKPLLLACSDNGPGSDTRSKNAVTGFPLPLVRLRRHSFLSHFSPSSSSLPVLACSAFVRILRIKLSSPNNSVQMHRRDSCVLRRSRGTLILIGTQTAFNTRSTHKVAETHASSSSVSEHLR
jgi:hypothetical protein